MTDREKVIKGLHQHCECSLFDRCGECPYYVISDEQFSCRDRLLEDVLFLLKKQQEQIEALKQTAQSMMEGVCLLKEQEPVPPEWEGGGSHYWLVCGECHGWINSIDSYCRHCGRRIKWDGN